VEANLALAREAWDAMAEHAGAVGETKQEEPAALPAPDWIDLPFEDASISAPAIHGALTSVQVRTGLWRTLRPVVDTERCNKCHWLCGTQCPDGAISPDAEGFPVIDYDHCKGCLVCVAVCPRHAIGSIPEARARAEYMKICGARDRAQFEAFLTLCRQIVEAEGRAVDAEAVTRALVGLLETLWQELLFDPSGFDRAAAKATCRAYLASLFPGRFAMPEQGAAKRPRAEPVTDEASRVSGGGTNLVQGGAHVTLLCEQLVGGPNDLPFGFGFAFLLGATLGRGGHLLVPSSNSELQSNVLVNWKRLRLRFGDPRNGLVSARCLDLVAYLRDQGRICLQLT